MRQVWFIPVALLALGAAPPDPGALDRDDAAAEAALARGDLGAALKYFDYFGHEQEDFARAMLEHRLARQGLRAAVRDRLGRRAWARAAAALGIPRHGRGERAPPRKLRREGDVVYARTGAAENEVPYVNVGGVWKVSVRDVLSAAVKARFGPAVEYEEADLHVLAGKMARVLRARAAQVSALADDVRAGRVKSADELQAAARRIRESAAAAPR